MRLELANAAFHIARLLEGQAPQPEVLAAWREAHELHENLVRDEPDNIPILNRFGDFLVNESVFLRRVGRIEEGQDSCNRPQGADAARGTIAGGSWTRTREPRDPKVRGRLRAHLGLHRARTRAHPRGHRRLPALRRARRGEPSMPDCAEEEEWAWGLLRDDLGFLLASLAETASDQAMADCRHLLELIDSLAQDDSSKTLLQAGIAARVAFLIAVREDRLNQAADALRDFRRAVDHFQRLDRVAPLSIKDRASLGTAYHNIGRLHVEAGRSGEALEPYSKAIAIREALHRADAENSLYRRDCGGSWHRLGGALEDLARYDEALDAYRKEIAYRRPLISRMPGETRYRKDLDEQFRNLTGLSRKSGRLSDAAEAARERRALWPDDPAVALGVAVELTAAAVLVGPGESLLVAVRDEQRRRCAALALEAVRDAARIAARRSHLAESRSGPLLRVLPSARQ